jgi:hypothetical protein
MIITGCSLILVAALVLGVGIPNHMVLRHVIQTLPLWLAIVLGARRSNVTGWVSLPLFTFWFALMALIWAYLLGLSRLLSGNFTTWEITMTVLVGIACVLGIAAFFRSRSALSIGGRLAVFVLLAGVQFACFRVSFLPAIAHR